MPITEQEIKSVSAPFVVAHDYRSGARKGTPKPTSSIVVVGFSDNDPLGVGGGMLPNLPTAHFEGGGWVILRDLLKAYSLIEQGDKS